MTKLLKKHPKYKIEICDNCKKEFNRGWIPNMETYSNINLVSHWTRDENKTWNGCKLLCVPCLLKWHEEEKDSFKSLVPTNRYKTFLSYKLRGLIKEYKG